MMLSQRTGGHASRCAQLLARRVRNARSSHGRLGLVSFPGLPHYNSTRPSLQSTFSTTTSSLATKPSSTLTCHPLRTTVSSLPSLKPLETGVRPSHHEDDTHTRFRNPWDSCRLPENKEWLGFMAQQLLNSPIVPKPDVMSTLIPSHTPSWVTSSNPTKGNGTSSKIKSTWLGHACFLVELPTPPGASRGPRILFDPVLSHRCSPVSFMGPQRFTRTPVTAEDLPAVDAVVISHCHYDHMDAETLKTLRVRNESLGRGGLHVFVPLGNEEHLKGFGFDEEHIHCMDWWDVRKLGLSIPAADSGAEAIDMGVEITCTPAQHTANRSVNDRWKTLWASFAVRALPNSASPTSDLTGNGTSPERGIDGTGIYFSGDTAYRTVRHGEDEDAVPRNPEFKEIGRRFGGFELALLPIGAYEPRPLMSSVHASPSDAVEIFKDIQAKRAVGMHWGTWVLTVEPVMEPPEKLKEACEKAGLKEGTFDISGLGETRVF